ncbi:hypothetical protein AT984_18230 [Paucibacter sp. KCTC 42545]|nr:hypothetical protein AT984_18230 [Paucibacter sp. KCTC 42545]
MLQAVHSKDVRTVAAAIFIFIRISQLALPSYAGSAASIDLSGRNRPAAVLARHWLFCWQRLKKATSAARGSASCFRISVALKPQVSSLRCGLAHLPRSEPNGYPIQV